MVERELVVKRLSPRDVPWYCGPAGGQVDVKIGLGRWAAQHSSKRQKKEEGPVVWPDPPDPSTPGPDSRFGAGNGRAEARQGPVRAGLPLILPKDFDLGIYTLGW